MTEYPLFPLDTVVFPGMTVPVTAFEERYKRLVRYCMDSAERRFVIAKQTETAPIRDVPAGHVEVGTMVDLLSVQENADGSFDVVVHGQDRCRIDIVRTESVLEPDGSHSSLDFTAAVAAKLERDDPNLEQLAAWDTIDTFRAYAKAFFEGAAQEQLDAHLPDDPYYQASYVCANLRVPLASRQVLLEAPSLRQRFELARKMMLELIEARANDASAGTGASANDEGAPPARAKREAQGDAARGTGAGHGGDPGGDDGKGP